MMKVEYRGYRIWAILQTSGKYRAWFYLSPLMTDVRPVIEGDTEAQAIDKAIKFIDGREKVHRTQPRGAIAGRWAV
jgi:hypothetical protein